MAMAPRFRRSLGAMRALGAIYPPALTKWTHPEDRFELIVANGLQLMQQAPNGNAIIAGTPVQVNQTQADGTRTVIPTAANAGSYLDMDSGAFVGGDVVQAWLADTASTAAANPTMSIGQVEQTIAPPPPPTIAVYNPQGGIIGYAPVDPVTGIPDVSAVGPKMVNDGSYGSDGTLTPKPIQSPGLVAPQAPPPSYTPPPVTITNPVSYNGPASNVPIGVGPATTVTSQPSAPVGPSSGGAANPTSLDMTGSMFQLPTSQLPAPVGPSNGTPTGTEDGGISGMLTSPIVLLALAGVAFALTRKKSR